MGLLPIRALLQGNSGGSAALIVVCEDTSTLRSGLSASTGSPARASPEIFFEDLPSLGVKDLASDDNAPDGTFWR